MYRTETTPRVDRHKIIVGLDYGTTFSGVSYVTSDKSGLDHVVVIDKWPNFGGSEPKAPTRIAYAAENPTRITEDQWGYSAKLNLKSYTWTKLLLDKDACHTEFDDPSLQNLFGTGLMRLPPNKKARDVCQDYLTGLYKYAVERIKKQIGFDIFHASPLECWVTVPAIWLPKAQEATMQAAKSAGFGSRAGDSIYIIPEPEAAALTALKPYTSPGALDAIAPGENILICDCGGGTVDITTYTITACQPIMEFEDLCMGVGGKCGSTYIDRNFNDWMVLQFGAAFTNIPIKDRGPGSKFMDCFESCKKRFESVQGQQSFDIWPIRMSTRSQLYDEDEGSVILSSQEMASLFDPAITKILELVESQVLLAKNEKQRYINRLILVGGFGESMYLYHSLKQWCQKNGGIRLICPNYCQAAIVKGAALRGLEGTKPRRTYCRFHYGYVNRLDFREGIDDEKDAGIDEFSGVKRCNNRMTWFIKKGQPLHELTSFSYSLHQAIVEGGSSSSQMRLFTTVLDDPPQWGSSDAIVAQGTVITRFDAEDLEKAERRWNEKLSKTVRRFDYDVKANLRSDDSVISFETFAYGKKAGHATFHVDLS